MDEKKSAFTTIDEYIALYPEDVQQILSKIRAVIHAAAPEATEKISYQMPTFYLNGNLIHFAAYPHHIGLYPTPNGVEAFEEALSKYPQGKGSVQFPLDQPIPYDLIDEIARFRAEQNRAKSPKKKKPAA